MNLIIPMAGKGKRLRPHTLVTPKPLVSVAGKPIVQRLVEDISKLVEDPIDEIGFIIGDFGKEVEEQLIAIAESLGSKGKIYHQNEALGTAHAVYCAEPSLNGPVIVAFADTLFRADFKISNETEGMIWVKQIEDPSQFGVVKLDQDGYITNFVEKPKEFVSDLAMIGIYFFKDGDFLKQELKYLMDNNIVKGGEYQLPDAMLNMKNKGVKFIPGKVDHWMDCGNKDATVETNSMVLSFENQDELVSTKATINNSTIIPPVMIQEGALVENSVIGPNVTIGRNTSVKDSIISGSLIQEEGKIENAILHNAMIGSHASYIGSKQDLSLGDYSSIG